MQTIQEIIDRGGPSARQLAQVNEAIVHSVIESMYQSGIVTDEHLRDPKKLTQIVLEYAKRGLIDIVVDHRETILETAKKYKKENNYQYATLFYAIYFEHTLNSIIEKSCVRNNISKKAANDIIKSVNIHGKLTWLLALFKLPPINENHKNKILKNADERNTFIHYKYNPDNDDPKVIVAEEKKKLDDLSKIEKTVAYIKRYESLIHFKKTKTQFKKQLKVHRRITKH
jgi:hypothetical protein